MGQCRAAIVPEKTKPGGGVHFVAGCVERAGAAVYVYHAGVVAQVVAIGNDRSAVIRNIAGGRRTIEHRVVEVHRCRPAEIGRVVNTAATRRGRPIATEGTVAKVNSDPAFRYRTRSDRRTFWRRVV